MFHWFVGVWFAHSGNWGEKKMLHFGVFVCKDRDSLKDDKNVSFSMLLIYFESISNGPPSFCILCDSLQLTHYYNNQKKPNKQN